MKVLNLKPYKNNYSYSFILLNLDFSENNGRCTNELTNLKFDERFKRVYQCSTAFSLVIMYRCLSLQSPWTDLNAKSENVIFGYLRCFLLIHLSTSDPNQNTEWKTLVLFGSLRVWEQSEFKVRTCSRTQYECLVLIVFASEPLPHSWLLRWLVVGGLYKY